MLGGQIRTGRELYNMLVAFTESDTADLSESLVAGWINISLSHFPERAWTPLRQAYTDISSTVEYELPYDYDSVAEWIMDAKPYVHAKKIRITLDDRVVFPYDDNDNTIYLLYNKAPQPYDNLDTDIPIKKNLRTIIYEFLISQFYDMDGEGEIEGHRISKEHFNRYEYLKNKAIRKLDNNEVAYTAETTDALPSRSRSSFTNLPAEQTDEWEDE